MNCEWLKAASAYDCTPVTSLHGEPGLEIGTPFSYADGTAIVLYAIQHGGRVLLSDNGDALAHLSSTGLNITRHRISKLRDRLSAFGMTLDAGGDVRALVPLQQGPQALAQAVSGLLAVAEWEREQLGLDEDVADLADAAEIYLREWKPNALLERHPKIKGQSRKEHSFDFLLDGEYIDIIPANHTATGGTMRKAGDVLNSPYLVGHSIRVVVDDTRDPGRAEAERKILGSLVKAMTLSRLKSLGQRTTAH